MLCKLHSISYNLSYIYIYIVKCFCKISQNFLFPAENQVIHRENRAAPGENGWISLDFTAFPLDFAVFQRVTPRFLLISSEIHWILQVCRRFRVDFSRFRRERPRSPWFISGRENPRKKPALKRRNVKSRNPPPGGLAAVGGLSLSCTPAPREKLWVCNFPWTCIFKVWCLPQNLLELFRLSRNFLVIAFLCG